MYKHTYLSMIKNKKLYYVSFIEISYNMNNVMPIKVVAYKNGKKIDKVLS